MIEVARSLATVRAYAKCDRACSEPAVEQTRGAVAVAPVEQRDPSHQHRWSSSKPATPRRVGWDAGTAGIGTEPATPVRRCRARPHAAGVTRPSPNPGPARRRAGSSVAYASPAIGNAESGLDEAHALRERDRPLCFALTSAFVIGRPVSSMKGRVLSRIRVWCDEVRVRGREAGVG
jgi:hypothetical protein